MLDSHFVFLLVVLFKKRLLPIPGLEQLLWHFGLTHSEMKAWELFTLIRKVTKVLLRPSFTSFNPTCINAKCLSNAWSLNSTLALILTIYSQCIVIMMLSGYILVNISLLQGFHHAILVKGFCFLDCQGSYRFPIWWLFWCRCWSVRY